MAKWGEYNIVFILNEENKKCILAMLITLKSVFLMLA